MHYFFKFQDILNSFASLSPSRSPFTSSFSFSSPYFQLPPPRSAAPFPHPSSPNLHSPSPFHAPLLLLPLLLHLFQGSAPFPPSLSHPLSSSLSFSLACRLSTLLPLPSSPSLPSIYCSTNFFVPTTSPSFFIFLFLLFLQSRYLLLFLLLRLLILSSCFCVYSFFFIFCSKPLQKWTLKLILTK